MGGGALRQSLALGGDYGEATKMEEIQEGKRKAWERRHRATPGATPSGLASSVSLTADSKEADPRAPFPRFIIGRLCSDSALIHEDCEHNLLRFLPTSRVPQGWDQTHFSLVFWTTEKITAKEMT